MGLTARTEPWGPFGRGWSCEHTMMEVVGDNPWPVLAYPKVWMDLTGKVVLVDDVRPSGPDEPTAPHFVAFASARGYSAIVNFKQFDSPKSVSSGQPLGRYCSHCV